MIYKIRKLPIFDDIQFRLRSLNFVHEMWSRGIATKSQMTFKCHRERWAEGFLIYLHVIFSPFAWRAENFRRTFSASGDCFLHDCLASIMSRQSQFYFIIEVNHGYQNAIAGIESIEFPFLRHIRYATLLQWNPINKMFVDLIVSFRMITSFDSPFRRCCVHVVSK